MTKQKNKDTETQPEQLIYAGPSLPNGRLSRFTVFRGGIPAHLKELYEKHPMLGDLTVPVSETNAVQAKIATTGTLEHEAFNTIKNLTGKEI